MTTQATPINIPGRPWYSRIRITRSRSVGLAQILLALLLTRSLEGLDPTINTILTLEPGPIDQVARITVPTLPFTLVMIVLFFVSGALAIAAVQRLSRITIGLQFLCGVLLIPMMLVLAAAGGSTNITTMVAESLRLATPLAIGAMAGIWCERSGVINIAIEGMMLFGACFGFTALFFMRNLVTPDQVLSVQILAVLIAVGIGGLVALLHAWLSITFRTDQIISGTVINILAIGTTSFIRFQYLQSTEAGTVILPNVPIPLLSEIPIVGPALFNKQPIFYMMFVIIILTHVILFYTRWGLRVRAVGEHPHAADTLGIKVNWTRWINVFIAGMIAGLAGAWFSLEATGRFNDTMTRGAGFIALAAMIFGKWTPFGAFGGAMLFGFADALGTRFQIMDVPVPVQFLQMVPYVVTIIVLAGFIGRAIPPKAIGKPYVKE